jgi:hypothetical protein
MAAVTLGSSSGSIRRSLILGHDALKASGYTKASLYRVTTVFFLMTACEWVRRGSRSPRRDMAKEGVTMWGRAEIGRAMMVGNDAATSWNPVSIVSEEALVRTWYLLQQVCGHHEHVGIRTEALNGGEVSDPFLVVFLRRHDLEDVEGCPGHVVADHLEIDELQEGGRLDVCGRRVSLERCRMRLG